MHSFVNSFGASANAEARGSKATRLPKAARAAGTGFWCGESQQSMTRHASAQRFLCMFPLPYMTNHCIMGLHPWAAGVEQCARATPRIAPPPRDAHSSYCSCGRETDRVRFRAYMTCKYNCANIFKQLEFLFPLLRTVWAHGPPVCS